MHERDRREPQTTFHDCQGRLFLSLCRSKSEKKKDFRKIDMFQLTKYRDCGFTYALILSNVTWEC